jgi:hypothetical protein
LTSIASPFYEIRSNIFPPVASKINVTEGGKISGRKRLKFIRVRPMIRSSRRLDEAAENEAPAHRAGLPGKETVCFLLRP